MNQMSKRELQERLKEIKRTLHLSVNYYEKSLQALLEELEYIGFRAFSLDSNRLYEQANMFLGCVATVLDDLKELKELVRDHKKK